MLGKLLKHEFRATSRIMGPLYLIVLATAVGANISVRLMDHAQSRVLNILAALLMTAFVVAMIGVGVVALVLMIRRFHVNLMGDEGYVMFTLPASVHQQICSKIIVSTVWFIATAAVMALSGLIAAYQVGFMGRLISGLQDVLHQITALYALNGVAFFVEALAVCFLGCAVCCLQFYAAMSIGHSFANHKVAYSVLFFFIMQFAVQLIGSFTVSGLSEMDWSWFRFNVQGMAAVHAVMGLACAALLIYGAVFYVITAVMLKRHLNLE